MSSMTSALRHVAADAAVFQDVVAQNAVAQRSTVAVNPQVQSSDYLNTSVMSHFQARVGWMIVLALFGFISGYIITSYEDALASLMILAAYIPMMADTGGNSGSQAATVIIQSLARNDLTSGMLFRVMWKEVRIAVMIAGVIALITMAKVFLLSSGADLPMGVSLFQVAAAIALALSIQIVMSAVVGTSIPMFAARFKMDPAVMTSPLLTSIVDISGMLIYFGTATSLLPL